MKSNEALRLELKRKIKEFKKSGGKIKVIKKGLSGHGLGFNNRTTASAKSAITSEPQDAADWRDQDVL